jgi:hypothetical protein
VLRTWVGRGVPPATAASGGRAGLDPLTILVKELRVQGCFTYVDEFTEVISYLGMESSKLPN